MNTFTPVGFDVETKSKEDIKKVGAYKYATDPSTDCLMFWTIYKHENGYKRRYWSPVDGRKTFKSLQLPEDFKFVCFNRYFEYCIWNFVLVPKHGFPPLPIDRFIDAQDQARCHGLDASLKLCAMQLMLETLKDEEGPRLIKLFCVEMADPRDNPEDWRMFKQYCHDDVVVTLGVYDRLPKLTPDQQQISDLTMRINLRGLGLDMWGCEQALKMVDELKFEGGSRLYEISNGAIDKGTQRARIQKLLLERHGVKMDNMKAGTIVEKLEDDMPEEAREILHIYQVCGKTSVSKFNAFIKYVCADGLSHAVLIYHGAGPGRWTGIGIQFHNMPRPVLPKAAVYTNIVNIIKGGNLNALKDECDRLALGTKWRSNAMEAILSCIRTMVVASPGKIFYCADFSAVEARFAVWIAQEIFALNDYRAGHDAYILMASETLNKPIAEVTDDDRFMGKQQILACQFGIGWKSFQRLLREQYNVRITAKKSKELVNAYRAKYTAVVSCWGDFQEAAIRAIRKSNTYFNATNNVRFIKEGNFLYCELPSGRRIAYPYPAHMMIDQVWDPGKEEYRNPRSTDDAKKIVKLDQITYLKKDSNTKQWVRGNTYGGSLFQGSVQGGAADLMGDALVNVEDAGYPPVLSVHDEALCEADEGFGSEKHFNKTFCKTKACYAGLPIKAETWVGYEYRKG